MTAIVAANIPLGRNPWFSAARGGDQLSERPFLPAVRSKVLWRQPGFVAGPDCRPVVVGYGVPGGVAVAALDDHVVAEDALEAEAEAVGGAAGGGVERVALPLEAAVAELVEGVVREQVDGLGGGRRALQSCSEPDVADLDDALLGGDAQVGGHARRALVRQRGQRVEERVLRALGPVEQLTQVTGISVRAVGEVRPDREVSLRRVRGGVERLGVRGGVDRPEQDVLALQGCSRGWRGRRPVDLRAQWRQRRHGQCALERASARRCSSRIATGGTLPSLSASGS